MNANKQENKNDGQAIRSFIKLFNENEKNKSSELLMIILSLLNFGIILFEFFYQFRSFQIQLQKSYYFGRSTNEYRKLQIYTTTFICIS